MENRLESVHFQITRECNLRCAFCGQWGKNGVMAAAQGKKMELCDWERAVAELRTLTPLPSVTLWGGEPLLADDFESVSALLEGFDCALVTNGTLIKKHAETINKYFKRVFVSLDGTREVHDAVRGKGVYDTVTRALKTLLKEQVRIMCVATETLDIEAFAKEMAGYEIILHEQIPFSGREVKIGASFPKNVSPRRHGEKCCQEYCAAPWRHLHIEWNGDVNFCTDFYDYTIGNFHEKSLLEVFNSPAAQSFREKVLRGEYKNCAYCSWRNSESFYIE